MDTINIKLKNVVGKVFVDFDLVGFVCRLLKQVYAHNSLNVVIITDSLVFKFHGDIVKRKLLQMGFKVFVFKVPIGEKAKSFKNFRKICNFLAKNKVKRTDLIMALGGGVVCDLAAFVASCYLRGVNLVLVPTTLLAMVDACLGGKAAINLKYGKNLVGCFKQPSFVFCDLNFIKTLARKEFLNAFAEIIKYAVVFSESFFNFLINCDLNFSNSELKFVVLKCLHLKKKIVEMDEFDNLNKRIKLNFGHTIGHALEQIYGYSRISHGQAVAAGMAFCVKKSEKLGLTEKGEFEKLKFVLEKFGLFYNFKVSCNKLFQVCLHDKKNSNDGMKLILLKRIGYGYVKEFNLRDFKKFLNA